MSTMMKDFGIDRLNAEQRVALALEIWQSLGDDQATGGLSEEQEQELAHRDAEMDANPGIGLSWQQVRAKIEGSQ